MNDQCPICGMLYPNFDDLGKAAHINLCQKTRQEFRSFAALARLAALRAQADRFAHETGLMFTIPAFDPATDTLVFDPQGGIGSEPLWYVEYGKKEEA